MNTKLNITSIVGVKDGIDQIFALINQHLDAYAQNTHDSSQIESCRTYVHQLNGLLDMLELNDITIVSQQMEKLMSELAGRSIEPEPSVVETIQQTTRALLNYLDELIEGALFTLSYELGIPLMLATEYPTSRFEHLQKVKDNNHKMLDMILPDSSFRHDLVRYYQAGIATPIAIQQFLSFYQILEGPSISFLTAAFPSSKHSKVWLFG